MMQQMLLAGDGLGYTLMQAITNAGLTSNLQLCLDAGDPASYSSGQSWLDRSGNGYDFFLGADGSGTATDPTFNSAGRKSYWSFDGGDYFTYDTTNETWMQNLHKDNANYTLVFFVYKVGVPTFLMSDNDGSSSTGVLFSARSGGADRIEIFIFNGVGTVLSKTSDSAVPPNAWHMIAVSLNEATGAGGGFFYLDGAYAQVGGSDTFSSTYSSPSAGSAGSTMHLCSLGTGNTPVVTGTLCFATAAWSTALTKANLDAIWTAMRGRFGI